MTGARSILSVVRDEARRDGFALGAEFGRDEAYRDGERAAWRAAPRRRTWFLLGLVAGAGIASILEMLW